MKQVHLRAYEHIYLHNQKSRVPYWSAGLLIGFIIILLLPWTQNIRSTGSVTTLRQEQRPQQINTIIAGRLLKWHIKEGDVVRQGDTLAQITEVKEEYLDPQLLQRTQEQLNAKQQTIEYYKSKIGTTETSIEALQGALQLKLAGLRNKLQQLEIKAQSDSAEAVAANNDFKIATLQYNRQRTLFDSGLVSLTQLEQRNQSFQNTMAKKLSAENKYINTRQEINLTRIEMNSAQQEYAEKLAKAEGDRFQSLSQVATGEGDVAKLQNQYASYSIRNGMYYILAPQSGQVVNAKKAGIGEIIKEGETLMQIVPDQVQYAVEMYVRPVDLPLVMRGQKVQFQFDGFPAIVFSGWPDASYGTFTGVVAAVESNVSDNGKFRVLVREDGSKKPWPKTLKMGTGARGIALLNDVPMWYELWRNINSFPPDYYKPKEPSDPIAKKEK
jgi:multidrug resistance efflux pump